MKKIKFNEDVWFSVKLVCLISMGFCLFFGLISLVLWDFVVFMISSIFGISPILTLGIIWLYQNYMENCIEKLKDLIIEVD